MQQPCDAVCEYRSSKECFHHLVETKLNSMKAVLARCTKVVYMCNIYTYKGVEVECLCGEVIGCNRKKNFSQKGFGFGKKVQRPTFSVHIFHVAGQQRNRKTQRKFQRQCGRRGSAQGHERPG